MSYSLKIRLETWAIASIKGAPGIPPEIQVEHVDSAAVAEQERLSVAATVEEQSLEGPRAHPCELEIKLVSTNRNADQVDAIFAGIEKAMESSTAQTLAARYFSVLIGYPENSTSEADRSSNTRNRSRIFKFDALPL